MGRFLIADMIDAKETAVTYLVRRYDETSPQTITIWTDTCSVTAEDGELLSGTRAMVGKIIRLHRERGAWPEKAAFQS